MTNKEFYLDELVEDAIYDNICGFIQGIVFDREDEECDRDCKSCLARVKEWLEEER